MSAITPATLKTYSAGSQTKYVATFATVSDADTWASGLGTRVQDFAGQVTADPTTNTSSGINIANSSGTFTFYPGVDALTLTFVVYVDGA